MDKTADRPLLFPELKYTKICMLDSLLERFSAMMLISQRRTWESRKDRGRDSQFQKCFLWHFLFIEFLLLQNHQKKGLPIWTSGKTPCCARLLVPVKSLQDVASSLLLHLLHEKPRTESCLKRWACLFDWRPRCQRLLAGLSAKKRK